jgi:malate dehydrogenase (oxaloacetate-decarboxylating)
MARYELEHDEHGNPFVRTTLRGRDLLGDPMLNKGSAFDADERETFGLVGLLPPTPSDDAVQLQRAYANIVRKTDPLEQYIGLAAMQDRNEVLFYRLILEHLPEFAPIVYTPTVGRACQTFSHIFRRGRGLWITPAHKGKIADVLTQAPYSGIRLVVVTDNERILGLGDQGAGGMGIPVGKLVLYTVGAGIHPTQVLPVSLDVGTDNEDLLDDPLYLGYRHPRLRGDGYYELVDEFVQAVKKVFPEALLQWEDFKKGTAFELLTRYRDELLSFNDDIQGTAAVALAGVLASTRVTGVAAKDLRVVILGAGAAGIGIGHQLRDALQRRGLAGDTLASRIAVLDSRGLIVEGRTFRDEYKREFAWPKAVARACGLNDGSDLLAVVRAHKPHVLIGTSGQSGAFTQQIVEAMAAAVEQPLIFPFSNPTSKAEAIPEDVLRWTNGKALIASGSPFAPVTHGGRTHRIGQGNNVFIFPGVGLGALVSKATRVTDGMFTVAAQTLAEAVDDDDLAARSLYPSLKRLRPISRRIAVEVALAAAAEGAAPELSREEAMERVHHAMWEPRYPALRRA